MAGEMNRCHTCNIQLGPLPSLIPFPNIAQILWMCAFSTITCHNQAIILKGVLVWDNSIVPTILWIKPSRVHYFKDWTGCFDINIKLRGWLRVCIRAVLGHSWDLLIIQPRLRMTENHCNPTATWLGLENGLKWPLFFSFRADMMAVRNTIKLFLWALTCRHVWFDPGCTCNCL